MPPKNFELPTLLPAGQALSIVMLPSVRFNTTTPFAVCGTSHRSPPAKTAPANAALPNASPDGHALYTVIAPDFGSILMTASAVLGTNHTSLPSKAPPPKAEAPRVTFEGQLKVETEPSFLLNLTALVDRGTGQICSPSNTPPVNVPPFSGDDAYSDMLPRSTGWGQMRPLFENPSWLTMTREHGNGSRAALVGAAIVGMGTVLDCAAVGTAVVGKAVVGLVLVGTAVV